MQERLLADFETQLQSGGTLSERFHSALDQATGKLVHLLAAAPLLLVALVIVLLAIWIGRFVGRRAGTFRLRSQNPYMAGLLQRALQSLIVLAGVLVALDLLGASSLLGAVLGSAGVVGLVLGFAFKDIAENYVAGVLLSLRRPFAPGDHVVIENREGKVVALTARATILITLDGSHLQLPNALVFKAVVLNYSRNPKRRFDFITTVSSGASWHRALELGVATIANLHGVLDDPAPAGQIHELSGDGASLRFFGWIDQRKNDVPKTRSEAMRLVRRALREANITPPEPVQRVQLLREPAADAYGAQRESATQRDVSVDRDVDTQVDAARDAQGGKDLLTTDAGEPTGT